MPAFDATLVSACATEREVELTTHGRGGTTGKGHHLGSPRPMAASSSAPARASRAIGRATCAPPARLPCTWRGAMCRCVGICWTPRRGGASARWWRPNMAPRRAPPALASRRPRPEQTTFELTPKEVDARASSSPWVVPASIRSSTWLLTHGRTLASLAWRESRPYWPYFSLVNLHPRAYNECRVVRPAIGVGAPGVEHHGTWP